MKHATKNKLEAGEFETEVVACNGEKITGDVSLAIGYRDPSAAAKEAINIATATNGDEFTVLVTDSLGRRFRYEVRVSLVATLKRMDDPALAATQGRGE